jgi:hypothetical protein
MVSIPDELKERNILKLILIVRFACATLNVGHPIDPESKFPIVMFYRFLERFSLKKNHETKM